MSDQTVAKRRGGMPFDESLRSDCNVSSDTETSALSNSVLERDHSINRWQTASAHHQTAQGGTFREVLHATVVRPLINRGWAFAAFLLIFCRKLCVVLYEKLVNAYGWMDTAFWNALPSRIQAEVTGNNRRIIFRIYCADIALIMARILLGNMIRSRPVKDVMMFTITLVTGILRSGRPLLHLFTTDAPPVMPVYRQPGVMPTGLPLQWQMVAGPAQTEWIPIIALLAITAIAFNQRVNQA